MALESRSVESGPLLHSDRGSQNCSREYQAELKKREINESMSATENSYDKAAMESFFNS